MKVKSLSRVRPLATPWTEAYQAPPPVEFSRQEYWSGVPLPSPSGCGTGASLLCAMWNLPRSGIEPMSLALAGGFSSTGPQESPPKLFSVVNFLIRDKEYDANEAKLENFFFF